MISENIFLFYYGYIFDLSSLLNSIKESKPIECVYLKKDSGEFK